MKNYMIKPNLKLQNFNIDYKLPNKVVKYNGEDIKLYGRIVDIDKRFPDGEEVVVESKKPDASADVPVWPGAAKLIPASFTASVSKATDEMKNLTNQALNSVQGMGSGLKALAQGNASELIMLAKLDAAIIKAKQELGEISKPTADELTKATDGEIMKAVDIKDPSSLSKAIGGDGLASKVGVPSTARALSGDSLQNFNIDKTQNYRDVLEEVDVRVGDGDNATFERQKKKVRVYGSEADLTAKYGARNEEVDIGIKYNKQKPSTTGKPSISSQTYDQLQKKWGVIA